MKREEGSVHTMAGIQGMRRDLVSPKPLRPVSPTDVISMQEESDMELEVAAQEILSILARGGALGGLASSLTTGTARRPPSRNPNPITRDKCFESQCIGGARADVFASSLSAATHAALAHLPPVGSG
mmetsp:Transcript_11020/g.21835  ORF Transcript_11020/g.21835 Transcript_11020/m.21835 type:complete len:127 (+) Transcript_11020:43-423(+)